MKSYYRTLFKLDGDPRTYHINDEKATSPEHAHDRLRLGTRSKLEIISTVHVTDAEVQKAQSDPFPDECGPKGAEGTPGA